MKIFQSKFLVVAIASIIGAIAGYVYWQQVGCASGTCPITSLWYNSTVYGAILGGLTGSMFAKEKSKE